MLLSLGFGIGIGIAILFLKNSLQSSQHQQIWHFIHQLLFIDITKNNSGLGLFFIIGKIFINLLQLIIIPLVFTSIILAIGQIADTNKLGRISLKTFKGFLINYLMALLLASLVGYAVMQLGVFKVEDLTLEGVQGNVGSHPLNVLLSAFPNNIFASFASNGNILAVVMLAIATGIIINKYPQFDTVKKLCNEINQIVVIALNWIIYHLAPIGIFTLLVRTFASYGTAYLKPAMIYMLITTLLLFIYLIIGYALFVKLFCKLNPLPFLKKISKVAIFGFSTSSSAATLPFNEQVTIDEIGVGKEIASFTLPLGMTINMSGTAIMQCIAAIFVASAAGFDLSFIDILFISVLTVIAAAGTPAAPGAGAVVLFTILNGMGYVNPAALSVYALILAINRPIEMLVTSLNVVGDSATAIYVANSEQALDQQTYNKIV